MAPAVPRELSVTYAGVTVGGASDYMLHDVYGFSGSYEKTVISFLAVIAASSEAAFKAACDAVEAAYRTPRGDLTVTLGATTLKALKHSDNTGYNTNPSFEKPGDKRDSGRSRLYRLTVEFERPADLAGQDGRRDSTLAVQTIEGGRRTCTVSGRYTAMPAIGAEPMRSARAQYEAKADAWVASILPAGTWRFIDKTADTDDANKNCQFRYVFQEVLNGARLRSQILVRWEPGRRRLLTITATYTASAGKTSRENAEDNGPGFVAAVIAGLKTAGVFQLTGESYNQDDLNQNTDATWDYEEVAIADGDPGPNVTQSTLTITRDQIAPGDSPAPDDLAGGVAAGVALAAGASTSQFPGFSFNMPTAPADSGSIPQVHPMFPGAATVTVVDQLPTAPPEPTVHPMFPGAVSVTQGGQGPAASGGTGSGAATQPPPDGSGSPSPSPGGVVFSGGGTGGRTVLRLVTIRAEYTGSVDVTAAQPAAEYAATIRPWIVRRVIAVHGLGGAALVEERYDADPLTGRVVASLVFQAPLKTGTAVVEYSVDVEVSDDKGETLLSVWAASPYAKYLFQGPGSCVRVVTEHELVIGKPALSLGGKRPDVFTAVPVRGSVGAGGVAGTSGGWYKPRRIMRERTKRLGTPEYFLDLVERQVVTTHEWADLQSSTGI